MIWILHFRSWLFVCIELFISIFPISWCLINAHGPPLEHLQKFFKFTTSAKSFYFSTLHFIILNHLAVFFKMIFYQKYLLWSFLNKGSSISRKFLMINNFFLMLEKKFKSNPLVSVLLRFSKIMITYSKMNC